MYDVLIYESGNGGEVELVNGDLATTDSIANQSYLSHFGGNIEAVTTGEEIQGEERNDWWGNAFFQDDPAAQMNSHLERALNENPIGSTGRSEIERRAAEDLEFMAEISETETTVYLSGSDKITISDSILEIDTVYKYIWDGTKSELIQEILI